MFGGNSGLANGVQVGDDAEIGAKSGVFRNVPTGERIFGYPAENAMRTLRMHAWLKKQVNS